MTFSKWHLLPILSLLFTLLLQAGCTTVPTQEPVKNAELKGTTWYLTDFFDKNTQPQTTDLKATLVLSKDVFSVNGTDGCNLFVGGYEMVAYEPQWLRFSRFASTRMACHTDMDTSDRYLSLVQSANHFEINGEQLTLYKGLEPLLKFNTQLPKQPAETLSYVCEQTPLKVTLKDDNASLIWQGQQHQLHSVISASGAKYQNNEVTFWSKGEQAFLIFPEQSIACQLER